MSETPPSPDQPEQTKITVGFSRIVEQPQHSGPPDPFRNGFTFHIHGTHAIALSPDGRYVAFGTWEKTIQVCDLEQPERSFTYTGHSSNVSALAWSPDSRYIASTGCDETLNEVLVWEVATQQLITRYQSHEGQVLAIRWSPDGTRLASGGLGNHAHVWNVQTGETLTIYRGHTAFIQSLCWSSDATQIASSALDETVQLWNVADGTHRITYRGHSGGINAVAFSPDGMYVASGGDDQTVQVWQAATRELVYTYRYHSERIMVVDWSPDSKRVRSSGWDGTLREWDATTGQNVWLYHPPLHHNQQRRADPFTWTPTLTHIAIGLDDRRAMVADMTAGKLFICRAPSTTVEQIGEVQPATPARQRHSSQGHGIPIWGSRADARSVTYLHHKASVEGITWSPDSTRLASCSRDCTVHIWHVPHNTAATLQIMHGHSEPVLAVAWSPDGTRLASCGLDRTVKVWDVATGKELLTYHGHSDTVHRVVWSPDSSLLASASSDHTVQVWQADTGQLILTYHGHTESVNALTWSHDGQAIASGGADSVVHVWNALTGQEMYTYHRHSAPITRLIWLPNSQRIASASEEYWKEESDNTLIRDNTTMLQIWDAYTGNNTVICDTEYHHHAINALTNSPDGAYVAGMGYSHAISVYDIKSGKEVAHVQNFRDRSQKSLGRIYDIAWSPDGKYIAVASQMGEAHIWTTS